MMNAIDLDKVIEGLTCCMNGTDSVPRCEKCPYADEHGTCDKLDELHSEALALLNILKVRREDLGCLKE